ncbi:hypothetical protein [Alicyclobacillus sp. SO9]|uniref:hypothetical protein n=1 Tax=Alicyclobacillus sp. SO9 TaxID=2665646 RepID=UPI0018E8CDC5|nr:hypothetical protein [Alicyclobacillus sp. SO9]QQE81574.1 hypothetical protein GI364_24575 [Alicyclobacillus sp. SO9]
MNQPKTFNPYVHLVKLGRVLESHTVASNVAKNSPEFVLKHIALIEQHLQFRPIAEFLSVFPLRKRYADDGTWNYFVAQEMLQRDTGTHFGRDDFNNLIMCDCFASPYLSRIGFAYMVAVGAMHKKGYRQQNDAKPTLRQFMDLNIRFFLR